MSLGSNEVDWVRSSRKKIRLDFVARTFALFRPVLHRVSYGNETVPMQPNSTKRTKTSVLGPMGWIGCIRCKKIPTRPHGTTFCTSSARFAPSFVRQPNGPECTQIVRNAPKCQFRVQWGRPGAFVANNSDATSWHELLD